MTAPVGKYVYYLTEAGYLVQAEADTGEVEARLSFSLPFPSDPVDPGGYYLTVEPDTSTLIVYLGDSQQLFAFKLDDGA
jgi:hypothetical protein